MNKCKGLRPSGSKGLVPHQIIHKYPPIVFGWAPKCH